MISSLNSHLFGLSSALLWPPLAQPKKNSLLARRRIKFKFLPQAASAASSSAADYPEHLAGHAPRKRRRSVAGVDQEELVEPRELVDADSCFFEFNRVHIHHKICDHKADEEIKDSTFVDANNGAERIHLPMILLHGFGASVFSWHRVMKPLARLIGAKVLAFDRPAFGLTSRVSYIEHRGGGNGDATPLNPYSMAFSVLATLSFIEMLGASKTILMGHSAGCLVAVETYFEAPEKVAALILVAPAIFAPLATQKTGNEEKKSRWKEGADADLVAKVNPSMRLWKALEKLFMNLVNAALKMLKGMRDMLGTIYMKVISMILQSTFAVLLVRMVIDRFGIAAIRNSWYDATLVTDRVLEGYKKPLKVKGWEKALLEYTLALLTSSASRQPLSGRLSQITCPVLIVTGDTDRLVPAWNAERLSQVIPGSSFEVIKNCGHLPHEEKTEDFLLVVERFLQKFFGLPSTQFVHVAT